MSTTPTTVPPLPTTIADHALLASLRGLATNDDQAALQFIAAFRADATVTIATLYMTARQNLLAEQTRNARLKGALEEAGRIAKGALAP